MMSWCGKLCNSVFRKKTLEKDILETKLCRCLSTFDLTLWGIGHMVGAGIYVLTGTVTREIAGPGIILSYLLAGFAAALASMCYAEFGARVPKAGSAYTYTYVTLGEIWAFLIGWNIILEHILGVASVAKAWSASLDSLFGNVISNSTMTHIGTFHNTSWLAEFPDFVALASVILMMVLVILGAKTSANFNNFFTVVNIAVLVFILIIGISKAEIKNWTNQAHGGFLPYGMSGVVAGAASCFFAYIGFEGIAVAGEEAKNPSKSIPIATLIAMSVVTVLYLTVSGALTLMIPWNKVDIGAPFPEAFAYNGLTWMKVVVAVGSLFGITTSLLGSVFSMPRAVYALSSDGLFFESLAYVNERTQTPVYAVLVFGTMSAILGFFVNLKTLVEFLSIGTLSSFTLVAVSVLILRYQPVHELQFELKADKEKSYRKDDVIDHGDGEDDGEGSSDKNQDKDLEDENETLDYADDDKRNIIDEDNENAQSHQDIGKIRSPFNHLPILNIFQHKNVSKGVIVVTVVTMTWSAFVLVIGIDFILEGAWWAILLLTISSLLAVVSFFILQIHEANVSFLTYQMPLVPLLPCLSIFLNTCLMLKLNHMTWVRMAVWLAIGLLIYFTYSIRKSHENKSMAESTHSNAIHSYTDISPVPKMGSLHFQQPTNKHLGNNINNNEK